MKELPIIFSAPMVRAIHPRFMVKNELRRVNIDDNKLKEFFEKGLTIVEIATHFNCSAYPIGKALKRLGLNRPAKRRPGKGSGSNNPSWKGGRRIRKDGYVILWTEFGERLEHQIVMEKHIGRKLYRGEIVHHIDKNRQNNTIENLQLMTQSEHAKHHAPEMHSARYGKS